MPTRPRARPFVVASALAIASVATLSGCSDGSDSSPTAVTSPVTLPTELVPSPSTSAPRQEPAAPPDPGPAAPPDPRPAAPPDASTAGPPTVEAFTVRAPLTCEAPSFDARVEWAATGAASATILVDSAQVAGPVPVSGPFDLVLACDGTVHTVVLALAAADGSSVLQTRAVLASPGG